jgi:TrmH family RNA methyltransferase
MMPSGKARAAITSKENKWLKAFRAALSGERDESGLVGVEGVRLVEAALGSRLHVEALLVSQSGERHVARIEPLLGEDAKILRTSDKLFAGVSGTEAPQGIAALVKPRTYSVEELLQALGLIVVLAGVQDPGNVGTIFRAAEALGVSGAAACSADALRTADPLGPKALRASAGSALRLPFVQGMPVAALVSKLRASDVKIYASVAGEAYKQVRDRGVQSRVMRPWEVNWKVPAALLVGNEGAGLPEEIVAAADAEVSIPQAASATPIGVESLNAAMAATVLLYEAMRQRTDRR